MRVLVLAEIDNGTISPATARIVAAASQLGPVDVLVSGPQSAADAAASIAGVQRVLHAETNALADALAGLLADLAPRYDYLVAGASTLGKDVMPRLAAKLDIQPVTDIVATSSNVGTIMLAQDLGGETVDVGRAAHGVAVAAQGVEALLVAEEEEDVGLFVHDRADLVGLGGSCVERLSF